MGKVNIRPEVCIIVGVRSKGVPVVGAGGGWGRVVGGGSMERIYFQQIGVLDPWIGGGGSVIIGFLPCLIFLCIGGNNTLFPFQVITDN